MMLHLVNLKLTTYRPIYQLWTFDEIDMLFYGPNRVISTENEVRQANKKRITYLILIYKNVLISSLDL